MTEVKEHAAVAATAQEQGLPGVLFTMPVIGPTTVEDVAFYGALGIVTLAELVAWPTAALIGSAHALHQRARFVLHTQHLAGTARAEVLEGALEATEGAY
jgi:hypothetical protein